MEEWKWIKFTDLDGTEYDYTNIYEVSNMGRIRKSNKKILKVSPGKKGYCRVGLTKNNNRKHFAVHRLVAFMFLPYPYELLENFDITMIQINHRSEIKHDNRVENLEWVSAKQNANYGTRTERMKEKLTGKERTEEHCKHISEAKKGKNNGHCEPVIGIHVKTGEILKFDSLKDSILHFKKPYADRNISIAINGENRTAYGYKWYYQKDCLK